MFTNTPIDILVASQRRHEFEHRAEMHRLMRDANCCNEHHGLFHRLRHGI